MLLLGPGRFFAEPEPDENLDAVPGNDSGKLDQSTKDKYERPEMTVYDHYALFNENWFRGKKLLLRPLAPLFQFSPVKWLLYFVTPMTKIYVSRPATGSQELMAAEMAY